MPIEFSVPLQIYLYIIIFLFGTCIFSFVNCAADRYVCNQSVLKGRSYCPTCGHILGAMDLIPIFSYISLRGKCRYCGSKIPVSCLIAELLGGIGYVMIFLKFGFSFVTLELSLLIPALMAVALIDLKTMEIPNGLIIYMAALFVAFIASYYPDVLNRFLSGLIGGAALGGSLLIIALIMDKALKRESLGGGDIKLFGAVGLFLGPWRGLLAVILSCIFGLISALTIRENQNKEFPFGPAICFATFISLLVGSDIIDLYLSLFI